MKAKNWSHFLPFVVLLGLVIVLAAVLLHGHTGVNKFASHTDEPVPVTNAPLLHASSGARFDTHDWIGRAYVVNFFASWCVPCRAEHEILMALARADHIPIVGIAFKDKPAGIDGFLNKDGNPFLAIVDDHDAHIGINWGITGVPETFVIDAQGIIRLHMTGPLTDDMVEQQILPLWNHLK